MFAHESWYRERTEPEVRREGVLAPHSQGVGPGGRGGRHFALDGIPVYSAGVERELAPLVGRRVVAHGKVVEVDGAVELWIGRIEPA